MSVRARPCSDRLGASAVLAAAAVAFAIRVAVLLAVGFHPEFFDADEYHRMAVGALRGHPMDIVGHPPGYSWFLVAVYGLVGTRPRIVYLLQAAFSAFAVLLVADAARQRWGPRAALVSGLLLAFDAYAAIFPSALVSENLCLTGVAAITWLIAPSLPQPAAWRLVTAVVVAASLTHVRTGFVVLVPALALLPLVLAGRSALRTTRPWAVAALTSLVGGIIVLSFPLFRAREIGKPLRLGSPMDSVNFWIGNNPAATGRYEVMAGRPSVGQPGIPDVDALERAARTRSREFLVERPWRQPGLVLRRASYLASPPKRDLIYLYGHGWAGEKSPAVVVAVLAALVLSFGALVAAALSGFVRRGDDGAFRFGAVLVILVALPYLASFGDARFMHPAHAAAAFLAGACVASRAGPPSLRRKAIAWTLGAMLLLNGAWDVAVSLPAMRAVASPGGSTLRPPYHFAR